MKTLKIHLRLNKENYKIIKDYCHYTNNLYNYASYITKEYYKQTNKYLGYYNIIKEIKNNENYKLLPSQVAQQVIKVLDKDFQSFFVLLRKKNKGIYTNDVNMPKFKKKGDCFNLVFPSQTGIIRNNQIILSSSLYYNKQKNVKSKIFIPFSFKLNGILKQIIIKPYNNGQYFKMFIQYEENKIEQLELNSTKYLSIDLGINNLASCFDSFGHSFIMNGKPLKSYNKWYNQTKAKLKSKLPKKQYWSKRLTKLEWNRSNYIDNYFNQVISKIIKHCLEFKIGNIIVGYNENWKQNCNIGKKNNQKFMYIPHGFFKKKLEDKCNEYNIQFILTEESYTSKCSFIDNEDLCKHSVYLGKRIKRRLFRTKFDKFINADINGAANIMKKIVEKVIITDSIVDAMIHPVRINVLIN